jgi:hypothetical protein
MNYFSQFQSHRIGVERAKGTPEGLPAPGGNTSGTYEALGGNLIILNFKNHNYSKKSKFINPTG